MLRDGARGGGINHTNMTVYLLKFSKLCTAGVQQSREREEGKQGSWWQRINH
jgi:hypothetical protein